MNQNEPDEKLRRLRESLEKDETHLFFYNSPVNFFAFSVNRMEGTLVVRRYVLDTAPASSAEWFCVTTKTDSISGVCREVCEAALLANGFVDDFLLEAKTQSATGK